MASSGATRYCEMGGARFAAYLLLIVAGQLLGYVIRVPSEQLAPIWPHAGISLVILITEPRRRWLGWCLVLYVVDASAGAFLHGDPGQEGLALSLSGVNLLEAILAASILHRLGMLPLDCSRTWTYAAFSVVASFSIPALASLLAAGLLSSQASDLSFGQEWAKWWLGDALGILLFVPALHGLLRGTVNLKQLSRSGWEAVCFVAAYAVLGAVTHVILESGFGLRVHFEHLAVPFLAWAALRFNWRVVAWTLLVTSVLIIAGVNSGRSVFADEQDVLVGVQVVQLFLAAIAVPFMLLAAFVTGLKDRETALEAEIANRELEERRRRRLEKAVRDSQNSEIVARMARGVAHDIKNMLTVVQGHVDLLEPLVESDPEGQESIEALTEVAQHGSETLSSLVALSRDQVVTRARIDLDSLLNDSRRLLEHTLGRSIDLRFESEGRPVWVIGSESQIKQALFNLVINARDALDEVAGSVVVGLREASERGVAVMTVRDNGPGIDARIRERIFDPFVTTKGKSGTGLGLAVVRAVARDHGGSVLCQAPADGGTEFVLEIPLAGGSPDEGSEDGDVRGAGELIFMVMDEGEERSALVSQVNALGFECVPLASAEALLDFLGSGQSYEAILIDNELQDRSGLDCARQLLTRDEHAAVALMSRDTDAIRGVTEDLDLPLLSRPCTAQELGRLLRQAIDRSRDTVNQLPGDPH